MRNIFLRTIDNYYWIFVLMGLMGFLGLPDIYSYVLLVTVMAAFVSARNMGGRWTAMDTLVMTFAIYQIVSGCFSDYPTYVWYLGVKSQVMPMAFYFIGRSNMHRNNEMMKRMWTPMVFAMAVGLVLYFWAPSWYMDKKLAEMSAYATEMSIHESTRLSSFWPWSYAMGYGSLFFLLYFYHDYFRPKIPLWKGVGLAVALLVLFFAQQRVTIAYFFLFIGLLLTVGKVEKKKRLFYLILTLTVAGGVIYYILTKFLDPTLLEYIINRSTGSEENMVNERFGLFTNLLHVSLLGEGLSKYGHAALEFGKDSVTDCDYIRLMSELGILGSALFYTINLLTMLRAFKYRKFYFFEFNIIFFNFFAMIGASPLENLPMQNFLLWYCMGRVGNKELLRSTPHQQYG